MEKISFHEIYVRKEMNSWSWWKLWDRKNRLAQNASEMGPQKPFAEVPSRFLGI